MIRPDSHHAHAHGVVRRSSLATSSFLCPFCSTAQEKFLPKLHLWPGLREVELEIDPDSTHCVAQLAALTQLTALKIGNDAFNLSALAQLTGLQRLSVYCMDGFCGLSAISHACTALTHLELSHVPCDLVDLAEPPDLAAGPHCWSCMRKL